MLPVAHHDTCPAFLYNRVWVRWTPYPVIVTIGDNRDYIRVLKYSYLPVLQGGGSS